MQAKFNGALHLQDALRCETVDCFVYFSSITAVLGASGQANYAASKSGIVPDGVSAAAVVAHIPHSSELGQPAGLRPLRRLLARLRPQRERELLLLLLIMILTDPFRSPQRKRRRAKSIIAGMSLKR